MHARQRRQCCHRAACCPLKVFLCGTSWEQPGLLGPSVGFSGSQGIGLHRLVAEQRSDQVGGASLRSGWGFAYSNQSPARSQPACRSLTTRLTTSLSLLEYEMSVDRASTVAHILDKANALVNTTVNNFCQGWHRRSGHRGVLRQLHEERTTGAYNVVRPQPRSGVAPL